MGALTVTGYCFNFKYYHFITMLSPHQHPITTFIVFSGKFITSKNSAVNQAEYIPKPG